MEHEDFSKLVAESCHLRGIFPEEIWEKILNSVDSSDTLQTLSNASPYFRNWFLHQRVMFLFPKVFQVFATRKLHQTVTAGSTRQLTPFPLLQCRLVCKTWRDNVNAFFEQRTSMDKSKPEDFEEMGKHKEKTLVIRNPTEKVFCVGLTPEGRDMCQQFMHHFWPSHNFKNGDSSPYNPFISRSITVKFISKANTSIQRYIFGMHQILGRYGHHLWHCEIFLQDKFAEDPISCYVNLVAWLNSTPNLKTLSIQYGRNTKNETEWNQATYLQFPSPYELNMLEDIAKRMPLPTLKNLESLKIVGLPATIANELISKNSHVSRLNIDPTYCAKFYEKYDLSYKPFTNLKKLNVGFSSMNDLKILKDVNTNCKLESLNLVCTNSDCSKVTNLISDCIPVFKILNENWSSSLQNLSISFPQFNPQPNLIHQFSKLKLNLPNLQNLKLVYQNWLPLDFILPSKQNLKSLHVILDINPSPGQTTNNTFQRKNITIQEKIQFLGYIGLGYSAMEKSNIWKMLPKLQNLFIDYSEYAIDSLKPKLRQRRHSE